MTTTSADDGHDYPPPSEVYLYGWVLSLVLSIRRTGQASLSQMDLPELERIRDLLEARVASGGSTGPAAGDW